MPPHEAIKELHLRVIVLFALSAALFMAGHLIFAVVTLEWHWPLTTKASRLWAFVSVFIVVRAQFVHGDGE